MSNWLEDLKAQIATIDTVVDSIIADYLNHGTIGLNAIVDLINAMAPILNTLDTRTASIVTDYLAHAGYGLNAILDRIIANAVTLGTLDTRTASIVTDYLAHGTWGLNTIVDLLNIANGIIPDLRSNLVRWGQITAVNGNTFTSPDLAGLGIDAMPGWWVYVMQADDAAPEGEYRLLTDYTDAGVCSHDAFSVALEVGDRVQLLHPTIGMLGEVSTAAATGAVSNTDFLMAYVKQLVTAAIAEAASTARVLCSMDFWSDPLEELQLSDTVGDKTPPSVEVADLPTNATVVRAQVMFKFRMVENVHATLANNLDGGTVANTSQVMQIAEPDNGEAFVDCINFVAGQFNMAAATREGGDVIIGSLNVVAKVDQNRIYQFKWLQAMALEDHLQFNDVQMGIRIWYSV